VLGLIVRTYGFSLLRFIHFIGEEVLVVFGTCSSESVLPRLLVKLNGLGCSRSTVGLVLPIGYSFNAGGTAIYLSMAALFIAQAYGIDMTLSQQIGTAIASSCDLQGIGVGGGIWLCCARSNVVGNAYTSGGRSSPSDRHQPFHVGSAVGDEYHRQRARRRRCRQGKWRIRHLCRNAAYEEAFGSEVKFQLRGDASLERPFEDLAVVSNALPLSALTSKADVNGQNSDVR